MLFEVVIDFTLLGRALFYRPVLFLFGISHIFYNIRNYTNTGNNDNVDGDNGDGDDGDGDDVDGHDADTAVAAAIVSPP